MPVKPGCNVFVHVSVTYCACGVLLARPQGKRMSKQFHGFDFDTIRTVWYLYLDTSASPGLFVMRLVVCSTVKVCKRLHSKAAS